MINATVCVWLHSKLRQVSRHPGGVIGIAISLFSCHPFLNYSMLWKNENGVVPQVGQLEVSIEEGLIQKLSRRVTADMGSGCKLLDATLAGTLLWGCYLTRPIS